MNAAPPATAEDAFTEALVDLVAEIEPCSVSTAALRLGVSVLAVREEMLALERLGCVVRVGRTKGTRWRLG